MNTNRVEKKGVIQSSELQRSSGKVLKRVAVDGESLVVERGGYPVAVMVPYREYEQMRQQLAEKLHWELVVGLGQAAERQGLTEEQSVEEMKQIRQQMHQDQYGKS